MGKLNVTAASIILRYSDDWQEAVLDDTHRRAVETVHDMCRHFSRFDSATMGFAAGLYYGKRAERERKRPG